MVAYRQPVSRARIVRGARGQRRRRDPYARRAAAWWRRPGTTESGAILYRTTAYFLERLGMRSLDELPPLAEHLPDLADLDEVLDAGDRGDETVRRGSARESGCRRSWPRPGSAAGAPARS